MTDTWRYTPKITVFQLRVSATGIFAILNIPINERDDWYLGKRTTWLSLSGRFWIWISFLNTNEEEEEGVSEADCKRTVWPYRTADGRPCVPHTASVMNVCETTCVMWACVACVPRMPAFGSCRIRGEVRGSMSDCRWNTACSLTQTHTHTAPPSSPSPTAENTHRPQRGPRLGLAHPMPRGTCLCTLVSTHPANTPTPPDKNVQGLTTTGMPVLRLCHRWPAHQSLRCNKAVLVWKKMTGVLWGESGLLP